MVTPVVFIGGGSGGPATLDAISKLEVSLTYAVPTSDSGGGLAVVQGMLGNSTGFTDMERAMVHLADPEVRDDIEVLVNQRFNTVDGQGIQGVRASNLVTAAFMQNSGSLQQAVDAFCRLARTKARITPLAPGPVQIQAIYSNGQVVVGEHEIDDPKQPWQFTESIRELSMVGPVVPNPAAIEALRNAKAIVICPGSMFTTTVAALIVPGVVDAIGIARRNGARIVYIVNSALEPGQTHNSPTASAHLAIVEDYVGKNVLTDVILHKSHLDTDLDPETLERYKSQGQKLVINDYDGSWRMRVHQGKILSAEFVVPTTFRKVSTIAYLRHDAVLMQPIFAEILAEN